MNQRSRTSLKDNNRKKLLRYCFDLCHHNAGKNRKLAYHLARTEENSYFCIVKINDNNIFINDALRGKGPGVLKKRKDNTT